MPRGIKRPGTNKGGRPSLFKKEYVDKLIQFFDIEPYKLMVMEKTTEYHKPENGKELGAIKKQSEKLDKIPNKMPTLLGFARSINVDYVTVYRWAEKGELREDDGGKQSDFDKFCKAYKVAKEMQKEFLISLGLSGSAPSPAFIFVAKNVTDMRDEQKVVNEHQGFLQIEKKVSQMTDEEVDARLNEKLAQIAEAKKKR